MNERQSTTWLLAPLCLISLGVWIWQWNLTWFDDAWDILPVISALPLLFWLGAPWRRSSQASLAPSSLVLSFALISLGLVAGLICLMALGWTFLLCKWLRAGFSESPLGTGRLCVLAFFAFPWLSIDFPAIGWWFRLSGVSISEWFFTTIGFQVERSGMLLSIEGLPVEVSPSCSGMNGLQGILIVGTSVSILLFPKQSRFWVAMAILPILALIANAVRILLITVAGLSFGSDFASGPFHTWGGLGMMILMFLPSMGLLRLLSKNPETVVCRYVP